MACYYAPNGQLSNLYEEAKSLYGEKIAEQIWYRVRTPEFIKDFGNWVDASKELSLYEKGSYEYNYVLSSYSSISSFVDDNFEPKIMYLTDDSINKPFRSRLSSFINNDKIERLSFDSQVNERKEGKLNKLDEVNYSLKATDILLSDKANEVFKKGEKNNWTLDKILTELQVPKEQKKLILDLEFDTYYDELSLQENIAMELMNNYTYSVESNTKFIVDPYKSLTGIRFTNNNSKYHSYESINYNKGPYTEYYKDDVEISEDEFIKALPLDYLKPTNYYSNLTVPGGTNYTENEILTPRITPSIKGHAQFSTDNGIGWFRSDESNINFKDAERVKLPNNVTPSNKNFMVPNFGYGTVYEDNNFYYIDSGETQEVYIEDPGMYSEENLYIKLSKEFKGKTRRILEVQSDLFQKGRNEENLSLTDEIDRLYFNWLNDNPQYEPGSKESYKVFEEKYDLYKSNKFLQLLNKDNNWVPFFVKSIIQDSAKKGYEKVLFPLGDTASKVEGHTTLEEFKKQKENRLKILEDEKEIYKRRNISDNYIHIANQYLTVGYREVDGKWYQEIDGDIDFNVEYTKEEIDDRTDDYNVIQKKPYIFKFDNEIKQLKQELERVEGPEGFGALKPIWNFYENTVTNILKKQGYNPIVITDEHGNNWNEVEIIPERDLGTIKMGKMTQVEELFNNDSKLANSVYEVLGFDNLITPNDKIVFGHPTIGKSYLKGKGEDKFISLDDDYATEINKKVKEIANEYNVTTYQVKDGGAQEWNKEYNQMMQEMFNIAKEKAISENKTLFTSNTNLLKNNAELFDKVINLTDEEFEKRIKIRGAKYDTKEWKFQINEIVSKFPINKVINTEKYLSDLFITPEQKQQAIKLYSQYLNSIFPDSKIKDIVYHGQQKNKERFDYFDKLKLGSNLGQISKDTKLGFFFGNKKEATYWSSQGNLYAVLLNVNNPEIITEDEYKNINNNSREFKSSLVLPILEDAIKNKKDSVIFENLFDYTLSPQYIIFEPEQIHILGSQQDLQGFKNFVENQPIKYGKLTKFDSSTFEYKNLNYIQDKFIKINPITEIYKELKITDKEREEVTKAYKKYGETKTLDVSFENDSNLEKVLYNGFVYTFSWGLLLKKEKIEIVNKLDNLKRTPITDYYDLSSNVTSLITDIYEDKSKYYLKTKNNEVFEIKKKNAFVLTSLLDSISDINNVINNYTSDKSIKENIISLLKSNYESNIEIVNSILFPEEDDDIKYGKMVEVETLDELRDKIKNLNVTEDTKSELKKLIDTGDDYNIQKVKDFIDNEEDELPRESLQFKDDVSGNTEPFFIKSHKVKRVKEITPTEISKAKAFDYDVIMSDKEVHVINPKVTMSPLTGKPVNLKQSSLQLSLDLMNSIISNGKVDFKKDYVLNKPWSIIDGVIHYNPSMITTENLVTPLLTVASGLLRNNKFLSDVIDMYGNKDIVKDYKYFNSKTNLDNLDYEQIAFEHLNKIKDVTNNNLILFFEPIVSQALKNFGKPELNILSTVNDFQVDDNIKYGKLTEDPTMGPMYQKLFNKFKHVTFNDEVEDVTDHAGLPKKKHIYSKDNGDVIDFSITDIIKQHIKSSFDGEKQLLKEINKRDDFRNFFNDLTPNDQKEFIRDVIENKNQNWVTNYDLLGVDPSVMSSEEFYDSKSISERLFDHLHEILKQTDLRKAVGTKIHNIAERIMTESKVNIQKDIKELEKNIKDLTDTLKSQGQLLADIKDRPKLKRSDLPLTDEQKLLDRYKATLEFYKELTNLRETIEARGGKILTEVIVSTDKMLDFKNKNNYISAAGQIDMLVIYENDSKVDPEYRGKVEIYDFKTMHYPPDPKAIPYYKTVKDKNQHGFYSSKQAEYALQTMFYARILEEELNFDVKDVFLIPIVTPEVTIDVDGEVDVDGHFEIVKIADYDIEEKNNKFTFTNKVVDGNPAETILLNIKTFAKTPFGTRGTMVYNFARKISHERMESKRTLDFTEENLEQERLDFLDVRDELKKLRESRINNVINDIKIYLRKKLENINRTTTDDPKELSKRKAEIMRIETDIQRLDEIQALDTFVQFAHLELAGDNTEEHLGLKNEFELAINEYNAGERDSHSTIKVIDEIRRSAENYDILDSIMTALLEGISDEDLQKLKQTDSFKELEEAIEIKTRILDVRYDYEMKRILGRNLEYYLNENLDKAASDHIKSQEIYYNNKIKKLEELIKSNPSKRNDYLKRIESLKVTKKKNLEYYKDVLIRNAETLARDFTQLNRDIGIIERWVTAPISTSSAILSSYAMMLKFKLTEAEWDMKDIVFEVQKAAKELSAAVFDQGILNFMPTEGDNPKKFYAPILEVVKEWVRDPVTGELKLADTVNLVSKFGTQKHTYINSEGVSVTEELTYSNIIKHYQYRLRQLNKEGKFEEYRKLKKEYNDWVEKNMERPNTNEYYEMNKLFTKDDIGKEAKKRRDEIISMIDNIKDENGRNNFAYTEEEIRTLKELQIEYKRLASIYDENGDLKTGLDYDVAMRIQEYNKEYNKRHNFITDNEAFERERNKARIQFKHEPNKYKLWLEENTEIKFEESLLDKVAYLRKIRKVLKFAKSTDDIALMEEIGTVIDEVHDFKVFKQKVDKWFEDFELDTVEMNKANEYELNEEINNLLKPYRLNGLNVETRLVPEDVMARVKDLEDQIQEIFNDNKVTKEQMENDPSWELFFNLNNGIRDSIDAIIEYIPNKEYYRRYEIEEKLAAEKGIPFKETDWFLNNHIFIEKDGVESPKPTRAWTVMLPTNKMYKQSQTYLDDKDLELHKLKKKFPTYNDAALLKELELTKWYLRNHDENGEITVESGYLLIDETKTEGVKLVPNNSYSRPEVKPEYVRKDLDKITDEKGFLLPKESLWLNSRYTELKSNTKWFPFYEVLMEKYKEAQMDVPDAYKLGNRLPYLHKKGREELAEGKLLERAKSWKENLFGNKATREMENDNIMKKLMSSGDDIDLNEDQNMIDGIPTYATSLEERNLPFRYVYHIDIEDVSFDAVSSILSYIGEAKRFKAKTDIMPQVRAILNLTAKRDKSATGGVVSRDVNGMKMVDAVAKKLGIEKFVPREGETYESALIRGFTEMQIHEDQNYEIPFNTWFGTQRLDKWLDTGMTVASFAQIGGITSSAWLKGFANYLQANTQMFLESWSADHYNVKDWAYAKKLIYWGNNKFGALGMDMVRDFSKMSKETLSGQLFEMYDALQGSFRDEFGKEVSASRINEMLRTSTWFINQNIGEIEAAGTSLYALLNSYKVIDGQVYDLQEFLHMKANEKGDDLTYDERHKLTKEFRNIKTTLLTSLELGPDGRVVAKGIKDIDGVPFLRSKKNMQIRAKLHGINKDLHGNYNSFDKTELQRNVFGRLIMMYRKYLVPMARRRWGKTYRNEEIGVIRQGYFYTFFGYLFSDFKRFHKILYNSIFHKQDQGLQPFEEANIRRAAMELGIYLMLGLLISLLAVGDDEDDEEVSTFRYIALYELTRLKKEIGALAPTLTTISDNWKLFKSPSAFNGTIDRALAFGRQIGEPFAVYERKEGVFEKGDSKLYARFMKLFGNITNMTNVEDMLTNLNRW